MPPLPTTSIVAGTSWHALSPDADVAAYVRLLEASRVADRGTEVTTEQVARHELTDPNAPAAVNLLGLADRDGNLLGLARVDQRLTGERSLRAFVWGTTHPAYRGLGIGSTLAGWAVGRAVEVLADAPGDLPRYVEAFIDAPLVDAIEVYRRLGLAVIRWYADMQRDLADPIPAAPDLSPVRIARFDASYDEAVRLAHNEAFADHWGSEPIPPDVWARDFAGHPHFRPDLSLVAVDGDQVAGYAVCHVAEADWAVSGVRDGWIGTLGVRRAWRKRGIATGLLVGVLESFRAAGLGAATLGVDMENPTGAVGLYERVGFRRIRRFVRLRAALEDLLSGDDAAAAR